MATHTVTKAKATDRPIASSGRLVNDRAAAGGPMSRLKISSEPTTGTAIVVTSATTARKARSISRGLTPRAWATSGVTDDSMSGRYNTTIATMHTAAISAVGPSLLVDTPRTSPKSSEKITGAYSLVRDKNRSPKASINTIVRAVATSLRARRPSQAIIPAPANENTPSPRMVLAPMSTAPAAPANAPLGSEWAANAAPRSTVKKPTTPVTTATMVAASQALIMNGANITPPRSRPRSSGRRPPLVLAGRGGSGR